MNLPQHRVGDAALTIAVGQKKSRLTSPAMCVYFVAMKALAALFLIGLVSCGMPPAEKARSLLAAGVKDESAIVRINAARGLVEIGDPGGREILLSALKDDDKEALVAALDALITLPPLSLTPAVVSLAKSDDPLIRAEAFRLIAALDDTACRAILVRGAQDRIARIRRISIEGLVKFEAIPAIRPGLKDADALTRIAAAKSLALLGAPGMENIIRRELDPRQPNPEIWSAAIVALADIRDTAVVAFIEDLLIDTPPDLKIAAARALLILNNTAGVPAIKTALASPDPFIRVEALDVVRQFPQPELYALVREATRDPYINVSIGAVDALRSYHRRESLAAYAALMNAPSQLLKIAAATAYLKN